MENATFCSKVLQDLRPIWMIYFAISLNAILSAIATLGNIVIFVALDRDNQLHMSTRLLFRSLALTDLGVGLISQPCFVIYLLLVVTKRLNDCERTESVMQVSTALLCSISLFALTAVSIDRLLLLKLGLRHRCVVTVKRVKEVVFLSWTVFLSIGVLYFLNTTIFTMTVCASVLLCLLASAYSYISIYFSLRCRIARILQQNAHDQRKVFRPRNLLRYKRTVSTSLWVYFILVVSYLPFVLVQVTRTRLGDSRSIVIAEGCTTSLVYLNSTLNPFIYCWRIREVRKAVKTMVQRIGLFFLRIVTAVLP